MNSTTWAYKFNGKSPEPVPEGVTLDPRVIEINGMPWQARSDCEYYTDYYEILERVQRANNLSAEERKANPLENELNIFRNLMQEDLWFLVYFVMKNPLANHPFITQAALEIQQEDGDSLEVWARDHLKTTIISSAKQIQKVLNDPERRIALFSATRPLAIKIQNRIKAIFESAFVVNCFPDIFYKDPSKEAEKWSESPEGGLIVKRKGFYIEATISSWGLVEGMPTGSHFTDLVFDDIVTQDIQSPDIMGKVCENFEMAMNLGTQNPQVTVAGTYYRHDDPLHYIKDKTDIVTGLPMFKVRKKPATVDGTMNGKSAFQPERVLAKKRAGKKQYFFTQQLLDATPRGEETLNRDDVRLVSRRQLPERLYKFMMIDGAGDKGRRQDREADAWAMAVVGVEPYRDEVGASRIYILDLLIKSMDLETAQKEAVDMYSRNGRILKLGIEKVGMSTTEIHICAALRAKGKRLSVTAENLQILNPSRRTKEFRIESALSWPLKNGKIHLLDSISAEHRERFLLELEKFPAWHDDGLDAVSYVYDIIKNYRFGVRPDEEKPESPYDAAFRRARERKSTRGWVAV